jgi:ornithine carbamoyltransferase
MNAAKTKRDFLSLSDVSLTEARTILALAGKFKSEPKGSRVDLLRGRAIAVVLEKASTRTRVSFEVGIAQLGAHPVVMGLQGSQLGRGEPIRDTARVLARYCDAIVYRTYGRARLTEMAEASVPVINALSDDGHPVQVLSDVFTIEEALKRSIQKMRISFVGDCTSNMARSWVEASRMFDFHLTLAGPEQYLPRNDDGAIGLARDTGHLSFVTNPSDAARDADVVNTDVWTSMGQEDENEVRLHALAGWTVNAAMMSHAKPHALVMHCLPAHRGEEIDHATIEGKKSRVWDQSENRLHVQKALMAWLLNVG